jgi:DNA-binding NarL/FixJ family response regulator
MGTGERTAVIVDHQPLWLDALESLLGRVSIKVVGRTTSVNEAFSLVEQHKPDVLVSEYESMQEADDKLPLLQHAMDVRSDVKCVVLATGSDEGKLANAFTNGAAVFCAKTAPPDDLALAIRQAFDRSIHFATSPRMPEVRQVPARLGTSAASLTKREVEILRLVSEGHSNSHLAKMLWVTEQTVKFHLSNIYRKLDVANRTEAARWAQVNNLLSAEAAKPEPVLVGAAA